MRRALRRRRGGVYEAAMIARLRPVPFDLGPVHFVGIGGIGMSGIARILIASGFQVSGSDVADSIETKNLAAQGAKIVIGHHQQNVLYTNQQKQVYIQKEVPLI